jgi:hypothetical protein
MNESTKISKSKSTSFEFFPSDWMTDTGIRMCSLEARGLWIDLICLMQLSDKKGYLIIGNQILNEENLRKIFGISKKKIQLLMTELLKYNLIKVDTDGAYFCKRIVQDEHIRFVRSAAGSLGGRPKTQEIQGDLLKQNQKQNETTSENLLFSDDFSHNNNIYIDNIYLDNKGNNTKIPLFKEKERKEEKKEKESLNEVLVFHPIQIFIRENCPLVCKLKSQMTEDECRKLLEKFSQDQIEQTLMRMENFKQLAAKYMSVYLTLNNWLNRQSNESTSNNNKPNNRGADFENALRNF